MDNSSLATRIFYMYCTHIHTHGERNTTDIQHLIAHPHTHTRTNAHARQHLQANVCSHENMHLHIGK